ncbi:MAG: Kae1-associated kinase Bud32 [Euryarchaeota archaeon]|jgi:Kae1-associated kinase Bud32|nr:Kae1-associated kinase Bud32 [Euryarchaeota archaeon]|tara:strand:- start:1137 stop:1814 length:678 start_codon:yes stop_codon:yes gene_type:complete
MQIWIEEKKLHEGAEAIVTSGYWLGKPAIKKFRRPRKWRHPELDSRLTKSRLTSEVRTLLKLQQLDFPSPSIFHLDLKNGVMFMEKIEGNTLVQKLKNELSLNDSIELFSQLGMMLRKLHLCGITHGDLTTTNIILNKEKLVLIDYGLSQSTFEVESYGLDFHVLYECLQATHPNFPNAMDQIVESYLGYDDQKSQIKFEGGIIPKSQDIISRFEQIKSRVRYHD